MPERTPLYEPDSLFNLLASVQTALVEALSPGRDTGSWRGFVGWSAPPEDCCPAIATWGGNLRPDPSTLLQGMERASCGTQHLFDISIRVSECYLDTDKNGKSLDPEDLTDTSAILYRLMHETYFGFLCKWVSNEIDELGPFTPITVGSTLEYAEGGCAGIEFTVTVKLE